MGGLPIFVEEGKTRVDFPSSSRVSSTPLSPRVGRGPSVQPGSLGLASRNRRHLKIKVDSTCSLPPPPSSSPPPHGLPSRFQPALVPLDQYEFEYHSRHQGDTFRRARLELRFDRPAGLIAR